MYEKSFFLFKLKYASKMLTLRFIRMLLIICSCLGYLLPTNRAHGTFKSTGKFEPDFNIFSELEGNHSCEKLPIMRNMRSSIDTLIECIFISIDNAKP